MRERPKGSGARPAPGRTRDSGSPRQGCLFPQDDADKSGYVNTFLVSVRLMEEAEVICHSSKLQHVVQLERIPARHPIPLDRSEQKI
jgi:hypothetical protein